MRSLSLVLPAVMAYLANSVALPAANPDLIISIDLSSQGKGT